MKKEIAKLTEFFNKRQQEILSAHPPKITKKDYSFHPLENGDKVEVSYIDESYIKRDFEFKTNGTKVMIGNSPKKIATKMATQTVMIDLSKEFGSSYLNSQQQSFIDLPNSSESMISTKVSTY